MNALIEHGDDLMQVDKTTMIADLQRAEIDIQVATAHKYPRSITKVARNVLSLATISKASAEKCMYALPRGGKPITGPSIRLAEIVFSQWGNCRGGARVIQVDKENGFVEAEAVFHDLESNSATTKRVRRRIFDKRGKCFNDDMILVTGNAACSIAFRNAVLAGVPEAIWDEAYQSAMNTMRGDAKTLPERREAALTAMAAFGLTPDQVWEILGIGGEKDFGIDQIVVMGGIHNALKEGETTVEALLENAGAKSGTKRAPGSVVKDTPKPKTEEKPKPEPETGEVMDAPPSEEGKVQEVLAKHGHLMDTIIADLTDASNSKEVDEIADLYGPQLSTMKAEAPDVYER
ncbi:MAG: hypothetical protein ACPG4X_22415, partial [Pikeienuella sp.]